MALLGLRKGTDGHVDKTKINRQREKSGKGESESVAA